MARDGSLVFDTKIDESGFKKGLERLQTIGGKALKAIGTAITATSAAIGAMGAAATKVGMDFEKSMSRVAALSGATEKEFKALEKTALELGKSTVFSSSQVAEAMQYLAMAGFKANETIAAMPGLLNIAAAGQTELGVAADITSNILSGFGLAAEEAARVADVLTKAFTSSNTSLESLGETMKYAAPVAAAAGFSLEEVAAAAGLLGDAGIQGSMAGTVLRSVMLRLVNPPKQAAEALSALGVSVTDSSGKMKPLAQIIKELEEATEGMTEAQKTAIISQIAGQNAASGLLAIMEAGGDTLAAFTKELENAGGTAERIANQQIDNLAGDIEMLKSALEFAGIIIYQGFDKPLRDVTQTLTGYIERIGSAIEAHDNLADGLAATADIIGEMLADGLGALAEFTPKILDMARNLIVSFIEQIKVNLPAIASSGIEIARSFVDAILAILPELLEVGIMFIQELGRGIIDALPSLISAAQDCIETLLTVLIDGLPLLIDMGAQILLMLSKGIADMMPTLITQAIDLIILIADTLISHIDAIIDAGIQIIIALVQGIVKNLPKLIEEVPRIINSFANAIYDNLPTVLEAGVQIILMLIKGLIQSIPTIVKNIPQIIMAIVNVFTLYNWAQLGMNLMQWLREGILSMKDNLLNVGKSIAEGVTNVIKNLFKSGINIGQGLVNNLITGIKGLFGNIVSTASNLASSVIQSIVNIFKDAPNIGKSLVQGLWNGIDSMVGWILDKIKGFGQSILNGIKGVFGIRSPSKVMKDEVGIELIRGIAEGIKQETPALRELTKQEMDKLISDYGRYGEEAVKKFAKLSKEEMDKIVQDSKKSGQDIAKAIAKGIEEKTHEISNALDKIRGETIKQLDRLGEATITALKRRYQEEERIQLEALQRQTENIRRETDKRIQEYDRELQAKLRILDDNTNAELKRLQAAIDAINEKTKQEEKELREQEWQNRIAAKEKELIEAESAEERLRIQEELNKLRAERERELILEHRQMQIEALRAEMDRIRQQAAEKRAELEAEYQEKKKNEEAKLNAVITNLEKEMEATKQHYATLLEEEALQAEARKLLLDENNKELIDLLESYNPYWFDAGQSFGQSLLDGLNSMKYSIQQVVEEILGMVSTVDMANARIIQAKKDWHEAYARGDRAGMEEAHRRAEEARKQGGTIGADVPLEGLIRQMQATVAGETARISSSMAAGGINTYSHTVNHNDYGITQHVTIVNPKGSPSENARQLKKVGRELALGY